MDRGVLAFARACGLVSVAMLSGCGASALLQAPVEDQCKSTGLQGCRELTEGTLAFVEGDKKKGAEMLGKGAAQNSPKELKQFAEAISALGSIPGVSAYMQPVLEVAAILKGEKELPGVELPAQRSASKPAGEAADGRFTSAKIFPARAERRFACAGDDGSACVRSKNGPFLVTDVSVTRECGDGAMVFSADPGSPDLSAARWIVSGSISNGKWFVPDGDMLVVAVKSRAGEPADALRGCAISWSATGQ